MKKNPLALVVLLSVALLACSAPPPDGTGGGGAGTTTTSSTSTTSTETAPADAGSDACAYGATYCSGSFCTCALTPPSPNCVTADGNGEPATGCDDGNPCTQDVADPAAPDGCRHLFSGFGASCSADGKMQCVAGGTGVQCCPTTSPADCSVEGAQAECHAGSVCMEGLCWIACTTDKDCEGQTVGQFCAPLVVGHVSAKVCGSSPAPDAG